MPTIAIIILNWNGIKDTLECLNSLSQLDYTNFTVVVVDNGSSDNSVSYLRSYTPTFPLTILETGRNLGYAGGNNFGINYALENGYDFILILNNDTLVAPDLLKQLVIASARWPDDGIYGPIILYQDQPNIIWSAGTKYDSQKLGTLHVSNGVDVDHLQVEPSEIEYLVGAALFLSAKSLKETGLFDTKFFLVHEETDWCMRAMRKGFNCRLVENARVWHKVGSSFGAESSPLRTYFSTRNHLFLVERNLPITTLSRLVWKYFTKLLPKLFIMQNSNESIFKRFYWASVNSINHWQSLNQRAMRKGLIDYVLRRFGDCPKQVRIWNQDWMNKHSNLNPAPSTNTKAIK